VHDELGVKRFLGLVEVDSGTLLVGDPLYCLASAREARTGIDYDAVVAAPDEPASLVAGHPVLLLARFGGDGTFPVFAELDEHEELVRGTIEFLEPVGGGEDV